MPRTLAALRNPVNAEDPAVARRQGPGEKCYAAVVLDEELPELDDEPEPDDEPESEEDDEEDVEAGFDDAGELLDELPRLSLR
jgi:hypothetical protein